MEEDKSLELPAETKVEAGGAGNKKIVIVVVPIILLVLIGAGVALFFLLKSKQADQSVEEVAVVAEVAPENKTGKINKALYLTLKPPFVIKAKSSGRQRFLQMEISLVTRDEKKLDLLKENIPQLRNAVVTAMTSQALEELLTPEGREALQQSLLGDLQGVMEEEHGDTLIEQVLFTTFVVQ